MFLFVFLFSHRLKLVFENVEKCSAVNVGKHFMTNKLRFVHKIWMFFFFCWFLIFKVRVFPQKPRSSGFLISVFCQIFFGGNQQKGVHIPAAQEDSPDPLRTATVLSEHRYTLTLSVSLRFKTQR